MLMLVIQNHPHRAASHLRRELVRCLACHGSTLSRVGASGKPRAVQRSPPRLFTVAACGGLKPTPDGRLRGACPHLLCSSAPPLLLVLSRHTLIQMPTPLGIAAHARDPPFSDLASEHRAKPVPPK